MNKSTLLATSLAILAAVPTVANASIVKSSSTNLNQSITSNLDQATAHPLTTTAQQTWLVADRDHKKGRGNDRDDDDDRRGARIDLNRAKNLARQAAEEANGGIRVYRAENSMHGPASQCPYVDQGDSWVFTFLGGRPGSSRMTTQSVVTVYKYTSRVVIGYNGPIRNVQQTQFSSFSTSQRTVLVNLLRGNCECNYLLTSALRSQILGQARSLPPGIQKQLLRGKGLPPGIAKKLVFLPKQVNSYINLPNYYNLGVIGSNLVVIDQVNYRVIDMIFNVL
ncbi:hypothetical protein K9N68_17580 [Kovacikia minuta CCNUW1]|uniref:hypothetical protein n=1 Tax=Kovacikia minuta TaxID=2931930 RepID=UPI001CC96639|nr:hypothetical protein [Kovacikia minuta]UBF23594.1 hypothetical protein K9N68_17580 [Kovacikia minuta CCNUW1]